MNLAGQSVLSALRVVLLRCTRMAKCQTTSANRNASGQSRKEVTISSYDVSMWIMEALVVLLVGYEVIHGRLRERTEGKRHTQIEKRQSALFDLIARGRALQRTVPSSREVARVDSWCSSVDAWKKDVRGLLESYSQKAVAAFDEFSIEDQSRDFRIAPGAWPHHVHLAGLIEKLVSIAEKPECYF